MRPGVDRAPLAYGLLLLAVVGAGCARPHVAAPEAPAPGHQETGRASWYGMPHHGRLTASGEVYDMHGMSAAHRTLPFGTWLLVENLDNGRRVRVRINDRGPFVDGRILDLSYAAARVLDALRAGLIPVRLRVLATPRTAGASCCGHPPLPVE